MAYFNFNRLINKYSREFTVLSETEGSYNAAGDYISGTPTETVLKGAIIGFSENKIHRSEGTLTANDKALHLLEPINDALMKGIVIFQGNKYRIETQKRKDNSDFTGCYSYTLKYCSAFDENTAEDKDGDENV